MSKSTIAQKKQSKQSKRDSAVKRRRPRKEVIKDLLNQLQTNFIIDDNGCWIWQGLKFYNGYGRLSRHRTNNVFRSRAHIASYQLHRGAIPKGMLVCHTCDVKACINPKHLWLGTNQQNQQDAAAKGVFLRYWTLERRKEKSKAYTGKGNPMYGKPGRNMYTCKN